MTSKDFYYEQCQWHKDESLWVCSEDYADVSLDIRCTHPRRVRDRCFPVWCDYPMEKPDHCPLTDEESKDMWI